MRVLKITDEQVLTMVTQALADVMPDATGAPQVVEFVLKQAERINRENHVAWSKELKEESAIDEAAWRISRVLLGVPHDEIVDRLTTLIEEAQGVQQDEVQ